ncbi:adenosylcobinamide-GDP ribazoletransferase [uncultured Desulfuromonas sp.]|uniref:adenosylcobinamide-GDP ribazoletransferase n=1 Tax=uncultured Desulfuromonas sp. TaxID=181013 RepID=UPI002AAB932D|nr:adenosylcobinamide-GDP ribazoletransferase [uncultured Desulfuromonas sp.]
MEPCALAECNRSLRSALLNGRAWAINNRKFMCWDKANSPTGNHNMMQSFFSALSFLTIVRVPHSWCGDKTALSRSLDWYAVVGLLIGAVMALLDHLLCATMPGTLLPSALLVVALIAVSGGLHIDGVADSADAFMSSRDRDTMLTIMKDSRVGAMGALTLTGLLLIKFAALASLPSETRWPVILLTPLAGRVALVLPLVSLPYARPGGLATLSHQQAEPRHAWLAASLLLVTALMVLQGRGLIIASLVLLATLLFGRYCRGKIGGFTGDTLGATCELAELVTLIAAVLVLPHGGLS